MTEESLRTDFDPSQRELCPDGACIGVIGADGRCAECGKASRKKSPATDGAKAGSNTPTGSGTPTGSDGPSSSGGPVVSGDSDSAETGPDHPRKVEGDDFDPDRRELCPDGACIGVIGTDGRCAECGTTSARGSTSRGSVASATPDSDGDGDYTTATGSLSESAENSGISDDSEESQDVEERQLCPDGACIGVIGSNGRCKSCGTRAE